MKKQIIVSIVGVAVLGINTVALAAPVVPAPSTMPQVTATSGVNTTSVVTSGPVDKKARLQEAFTKMQNSLQVRITVLEGLATRIQSRITKMEQEGKDVTAAKAALANAQKAITAAKTDMATLDKRIAAMIAAKNPATAFATIKRSTTLGVAAKIKAAHKALVDTVIAMKGAGTKTAVPATTTISTTTAQ